MSVRMKETDAHRHASLTRVRRKDLAEVDTALDLFVCTVSAASVTALGKARLNVQLTEAQLKEQNERERRSYYQRHKPK
eukprot:5952891-Amphidinium_carterae.1